MEASERLRNLLSGRPVDRLPVIEWAPWWKLTVERWLGEGLPKKAAATTGSLQEYFGLDRCLQLSVKNRTKTTPKERARGAGIMADERDYKKIRPTLFPDVRTVVTDERIELLHRQHEDGNTLHFLTVEGAFWYPRVLFGIENHLYSFYDYPELYLRICDELADWLVELFRYLLPKFRFDFMSFAEDMSYNNGPMLSKELFDGFLAPFYKKVIPVIHEYGVPVFIDSDGDITLALDWYASVGADGMFPLERQAGVDVSVYLDKQPAMAFLGHFDKMCMKHGEAAMRAEFERLLPSMHRGKFIPSCDHQTPPDVSVENYRTYVKLLREYAEQVTHRGAQIAPCPVFSENRRENL
jgi:hypothetical protein